MRPLHVHKAGYIFLKNWVTSVDKDIEKLKLSFTANGNAKWHHLFGKVFQLLKLNTVIIWPNNSTPRFIPKRTKNICPHKNLCTNVHSRSIPKSQKVETTQKSIN
jgi:hypothetical protein